MFPFTLAVVPSAMTGDTHAALAELCAVLSADIGREVRGVHPESYSALVTELEHDRVHFAWMSPMLMVLAEERLRLRPLLSAVRGDRTEYCAALFVRGRSPIRSLEELRGKTVAWVDLQSASGYLYPRLQLAARGIDPADVFGRELFLRSHAAVVRAVLDGTADVGATYAERPVGGQPVTRAGFCDVAPGEPVRVIDWTRPIPNDVIAGHKMVPKPQQLGFASAILKLVTQEYGRKLLYGAFHAESFASAPRNALVRIERLVELARERGLLSQL